MRTGAIELTIGTMLNPAGPSADRSALIDIRSGYTVDQHTTLGRNWHGGPALVDLASQIPLGQLIPPYRYNAAPIASIVGASP